MLFLLLCTTAHSLASAPVCSLGPAVTAGWSSQAAISPEWCPSAAVHARLVHALTVKYSFLFSFLHAKKDWPSFDCAVCCPLPLTGSPFRLISHSLCLVVCARAHVLFCMCSEAFVINQVLSLSAYSVPFTITEKRTQTPSCTNCCFHSLRNLVALLALPCSAMLPGPPS